MKSPLAWLFLGVIKVYRAVISPLSQPRCKFYPTCSTYALQAVNTHGAIKGMALSTHRICRCHPWSLGGIDYVPRKGEWKAAPHYEMSEEELQAYWEAIDNADEGEREMLIKSQLHRNSDLAYQQHTAQSARSNL